ncbi:MAG: hypothetical protein CTY35_00340 [Methylotenera sp.]|uniref:hypothetical protein n=1 Tax=Methylotenera sp. TaxID=2051956 RepID=UPI000D49B0DA|nr:hypothetical protein [Methylotenera sp.]PPC84803.1 MAG: hypothetical protein CTY38_00335 [Methylotenera sp.]PPD02163.1 MAG: hypothetical protein CTY35_00340 [Methylotenera sp.]
MSLLFKQTGALSPNEVLSKAILKTTEVQKDTVKKPIESTAEVSNEKNITDKAVVNASADPLANPARKSVFVAPKSNQVANEVKLPDAAQDGASAQPQKVTQAPIKTMPEKKTLATMASAPNPAKRTLQDVANKTHEAKANGFDAKIMLNTFKVFEPVISASTFSHGDASSANAAKAIEAITSQSESLTKALCKLTGVDFLDQDKQWVVSQLRLIASTHVSAAYKRNPDPDQFNCDHFIEAFESVQKTFSVQPEANHFPDMTDSLRVRLSLMKSLNPVIKEYGLFENVVASMVKNFKIDRAAIFDHASKLIQEKSKDFVSMTGVEKDDSGELIIYQSMLNASGTVMSNCIAYACDRTLDHLDGLNTEQRQKYVESQMKAGNFAIIDLELLENQFNETMQALSGIVKNSPLIYATKSNSPRM